MVDRIELDTTGARKVGSAVRKGVEILRIEAEPSAEARPGALAVYDTETVFRPRPGLVSGSARLMVKSSPFDPLGEVPVVGDSAACVG
jgi:hypothetical protein